MESMRLPVFLVISAHVQILDIRPLFYLPLRGLGTRLVTVMSATMVKGQVAIKQETFWKCVVRLPQPQLKMTAALQLCDPVL